MTNRTVSQDVNDYRIVVLGSASVGKTSILTRFIHGTFKDNYSPTIEDTYRRVVTLDSSVCTLHITDTGGSHHFPAMKDLALKRGHAFLVIYSVSNRKSFENIQTFYTEILSVRKTLNMIPFMIVGNKCDLKEREVTEAEGLSLAKQWGCSYIETSAKQDFQIQKLFEELLFLEKRHSMSLETQQSKKKKSPSDKKVDVEKQKHKCTLM